MNSRFLIANTRYLIAVVIILIILCVGSYLLFSRLAPITEAELLIRAGQFMSGILIASTALIGVAAVFLLQMRLSSKIVFTKLWQTLFRWYSTLSLIAGAFVIISILAWLLSDELQLVYITWALFYMQIGLVIACALRIGFSK